MGAGVRLGDGSGTTLGDLRKWDSDVGGRREQYLIMLTEICVVKEFMAMIFHFRVMPKI